MYPAAEFKANMVFKGPVFVIDEYFLCLFSLEDHWRRIIPHRNASVP